MDPTLFSLAHKLQAEELERDAQEHPSTWSKSLLRWGGGLLVAVGKKLQANEPETQTAFQCDGCSPVDKEVCA
ncbi:MAG: hypothetical protein K8L97_15680 [Anaerolineae bacterium]|nr:hypothetical protein [Anaerolineae bacterium]